MKVHPLGTKPRPKVMQAAHVAVKNALRRGDLVRPGLCEECQQAGTPRRDGRATIEAHHDDYERPLEVRWLCRPCHKAVHVGQPSRERPWAKAMSGFANPP